MALVTVMSILTVMAVLAIAILMLSGQEQRSAVAYSDSVRVRQLADIPVFVGAGVDETLDEILADAAEDDLVVVFGSFLTVAAAMAWLENNESEAAKA